MPEQYQVVFCSRGNNVINNTNLNAVQYTVNWGAFLPKKYKRFLCQFIFKSENYATSNGTILSNNGFVNINMGSGYTFDGVSRSNNFGIIYPVVLNYSATACSSFYNSTNNDNNQFYMDYPFNNQVTITLNKFDGTAMGNMQHYALYLNMVGVTDTEDKEDNAY